MADEGSDGRVGQTLKHAVGMAAAAGVYKALQLTWKLVTGSLNASLAAWLLDRGYAQAPYVASQGTVLGRAGRVHISRDSGGTIWVAGAAVTCVTGEVDL